MNDEEMLESLKARIAALWPRVGDDESLDEFEEMMLHTGLDPKTVPFGVILAYAEREITIEEAKADAIDEVVAATGADRDTTHSHVRVLDNGFWGARNRGVARFYTPFDETCRDAYRAALKRRGLNYAQVVRQFCREMRIMSRSVPPG
jgi:hypothetical protein